MESIHQKLQECYPTFTFWRKIPNCAIAHWKLQSTTVKVRNDCKCVVCWCVDTGWSWIHRPATGGSAHSKQRESAFRSAECSMERLHKTLEISASYQEIYFKSCNWNASSVDELLWSAVSVIPIIANVYNSTLVFDQWTSETLNSIESYSIDSRPLEAASILN